MIPGAGLVAGLFKWLGGGALDRILDTVDAKTRAGTDREKLRADVIRTHMETRPGFLAAGGFWLMFFGGLPYVIHGAAVAVYSMLWCAGCAFPKEWTIAALPPPHDQYQAHVIMAWLGLTAIAPILPRAVGRRR